MTHLDGSAQFAEPFRDRTQFGVGPRDLVSESEQNFSDRAHPNAPDANEVDVLGLKKHYLPLLFRLYGRVSNKNLFFLSAACFRRLLPVLLRLARLPRV